ncbi:hypothetical protein TOPH_01231 [Tolypocladium ophioglossoides CBS 100239]|uniref:Uncharacterized protein n=1 Tax=Tolypocladium ophioglossoides (strain CBS 100239) TaxID=1163406 RepID=A0A0L0NJS9_TOLOC|nr:hypothetical protein TOPH_01231 [Tolypocladium ophioglossoides CBS 100239]
MYKDYPGQVLFILLRNTGSTDSGTSCLPDDLTHLDIVKGQCLNGFASQNLTFKEQGLPLGLGDGGSMAGRFGSPVVLRWWRLWQRPFSRL